MADFAQIFNPRPKGDIYADDFDCFWADYHPEYNSTTGRKALYAYSRWCSRNKKTPMFDKVFWHFLYQKPHYMKFWKGVNIHVWYKY